MESPENRFIDIQGLALRGMTASEKGSTLRLKGCDPMSELDNDRKVASWPIDFGFRSDALGVYGAPQ